MTSATSPARRTALRPTARLVVLVNLANPGCGARRAAVRNQRKHLDVIGARAHVELRV